MIRAARDDDAGGLVALVGACWAEYPGCVLDVDGEEPHLRRIASAYAEWAGEVFVAEEAGVVVGSVGWVPSGAAGIELRMLYVAAAARRRGLGARLAGLVEDAARGRGAAVVELWSDTRFHDAHRLYARLGYARSARTRELHDLSNTVEHHFRKRLR
ncbi:MAG TPA: GNAT family N-acetyltransferase [Candidatus Dormibacteraeota bacterium]